MTTSVLRHVSTLLLLLGIGVVLWLFLDNWTRTDGRANLYVWQADAWLHGRTSLPSRFIDVALWQGRVYVPFPPFPSVVLLPLVALLGVVKTNTLPVTLALTAISGLALERIGGRLGLARERRYWLTAALLFGTGYANALVYGSTVWFFAHAVSFCCLLLAVAEGLGKRRGAVLGLLIGASFLSRQMTGLALLVALVPLWPHRRSALALVGTFAVCVALYLGYNALRFGSPLATGYDLLELNGSLKARAQQYGLFHIAFLPFNLSYLLLQGPSLAFGGESRLTVLGVDAYGTALPLASPFLLACLGARPAVLASRLYLRTVGLTVLLILAPTLLYYNNGYQQINCQRFTLDFLPLLVVPLALGQARLSEPLWRALVLWSVLLNALMLTISRFH